MDKVLDENSLNSCKTWPDVVVADINLEEAENVVKEIEELGRKAIACQVNVAIKMMRIECLLRRLKLLVI